VVPHGEFDIQNYYNKNRALLQGREWIFGVLWGEDWGIFFGDGRDSAPGGTMTLVIASGSLRWQAVFALTQAI
jgi:hypothetical protein